MYMLEQLRAFTSKVLKSLSFRVRMPLILLKTENNNKIISDGTLFICLNTLFMFHEQCKRRW